jgi:hypothetical protein
MRIAVWHPPDSQRYLMLDELLRGYDPQRRLCPLGVEGPGELPAPDWNVSHELVAVVEIDSRDSGRQRLVLYRPGVGVMLPRALRQMEPGTRSVLCSATAEVRETLGFVADYQDLDGPLDDSPLPDGRVPLAELQPR